LSCLKLVEVSGKSLWTLPGNEFTGDCSIMLDRDVLVISEGNKTPITIPENWDREKIRKDKDTTTFLKVSDEGKVCLHSTDRTSERVYSIPESSIWCL
jgi:hypothetical protein